MKTYRLCLILKSDTTLGRGEGVAGLVDAEVEHDQYGLPYLRGRTLKGLLAEECANLFFSFRQAPSVSPEAYEDWEAAAHFLFGRPGSTLEDDASMHVGSARLPADLRAAVRADLAAGRYTLDEVLESLTTIRRQTAMDESGVPDPGSLRSSRVILRETPLEAPLYFADPPEERMLALLGACAQALRRVGVGRNRGCGRVEARLCTPEGDTISPKRLFRLLGEEVSV